MRGDAMSADHRSGRARSGLHVAVRWVGLSLYVAVGALYLSTGLLAPPWAVGVLDVLWVTGLYILLRVWRTHPWIALAAPFVAYLIWAGALLAGDVFLGWTA